MIRLTLKVLNVGDVEDPEVYLGAAVWDWIQTEHGAWCKENAQDLVYSSFINHQSYTTSYAITGLFSEEDAFLYKLQWGNTA